MRHEHERGAAVDEELLHPLHRLDIEMVGGFIQQQDVGLPHECAREQRLSLAAAGRRLEWRIGVETEVLEDSVHARLHFPRVGGVERMMQAVELLERRVAGVLSDAMTGVVVASQQEAGLSQSRSDDVERGALDIVRNLLLEPTHGHAGLAHHVTTVR